MSELITWAVGLLKSAISFVGEPSVGGIFLTMFVVGIGALLYSNASPDVISGTIVVFLIMFLVIALGMLDDSSESGESDTSTDE